MIRPMDSALYRLSRPAGQAFGAMGVLLLLLPKVNLVELQNGAAGLRMDDILLASCLMLFAAVRIYYSDLRLTKVELAFAGWMVALLASNAVNVTLYGRSNWLYSLRYLEYFLFFYFGYYFAQRHELRSLARAVLWINGPIMVLQMFNLIGGYASAGYTRGMDRPIGLTGGPWEIGVLINFCLAIFLFDGRVSKKSAVWALFRLVVTRQPLDFRTMVPIPDSSVPALRDPCRIDSRWGRLRFQRIDTLRYEFSAVVSDNHDPHRAHSDLPPQTRSLFQASL